MKARDFRLANNARMLLDNIINCMLYRNFLTIIAKKKLYNLWILLLLKSDTNIRERIIIDGLRKE